jgi:gliding motility-associated-like protein
MRYLLFSIFFHLGQVCYCQYVYVSTDKNEIYRLNLSSGCSATFFAQCGSPGSDIKDIAIDAFGKLYICRGDSIFMLDTNNPGAGCSFVTTLGIYKTNAIEIGPDGKLYFADKRLVRYNLINHNFEDLGELPASMIAPGDLVFYVNRLYMSSASGSIYEVDINNPARSQPYYTPGISNFTGFVVSPARCFNATSDELRLFAFEDLGNGQSAVHILDMEKRITYFNFCKGNITIKGNSGFHPPPVVTEEIRNAVLTISSPACPQTTDGSIKVNIPGQNAHGYSFWLNNTNENTTGIFTNLGVGNYTLTLRDKLGCAKDTFATIVSLNNTCVDSFYVPKAFTPNGDGKNDIFRVRSFIPFSYFQIRVYDRNGQCVFNSNAMLEGWDGTIKGKIQATNVFLWVISYKDLQGRALQRTGLVTLIR